MRHTTTEHQVSSRRSRHSRRRLLGTALALVLTDAVVAATGAVGGGHGSSGHVAVAAPRTESVAPTTAAASTSTSSTALPTTAASTTAPPVRAATASGGSGQPAGDPPATAAPAEPVPGPGNCPAGDCVEIDTTHPIGPVNHAGSGYNLLPSSNTDTSAMRRLGATMYRSVPAPGPIGTYDWSSWDAATAAGAPTTIILSNLWAQHFSSKYPQTPWSDWSAYDQWVQRTVSNILLTGQRVDYWDVYNEPGWSGYYSPSDYASMTPNDLLQQFLHSYDDITSVARSAAIIGPSIGDFTLTPMPPNNLTREPDLATFLRFCADHGLQLAAVAWHDNGRTPTVIYNDAQQVWQLIHSLPGLGHPQMFLDEYGAKPTQPIPGWDVGFLSTIARAGIGSAERSCWDGCTLSTLDGLLTGNEQPTSDYYVRVTYGQMSGQMASVGTTADTVAGLGSLDTAGTQVVGLIGRDASCAVASWCRTQWSQPDSPAPPESVQVSVVVPWSNPNVHVQLSYESFQPGAAVSGATPVSPAGLAVIPQGRGREAVTFTINGFQDGSAYNLQIQGS